MLKIIKQSFLCLIFLSSLSLFGKNALFRAIKELNNDPVITEYLKKTNAFTLLKMLQKYVDVLSQMSLDELEQLSKECKKHLEMKCGQQPINESNNIDKKYSAEFAAVEVVRARIFPEYTVDDVMSFAIIIGNFFNITEGSGCC